MLLHEAPDFADLVAVTARGRGIDPGLVEKDYWIVHGLWGLQRGGFTFELKGGTSLSKGYGPIHRFSEDIDILIHPDDELPVGRNQNKPAHVLNYWGAHNDDAQMKANAQYIKEEFLDKGSMGLQTARGYYSYPDPTYASPNFLDVPEIAGAAELARLTFPKD